MNDNTEETEKLLHHIRSIYVPNHEYISVALDDYPHVDKKFYNTTRAFLESEGFNYFEDSEDLTLAKAPGNMFRPVPIRSLVSHDGVIAAGLYHPRLTSFWMAVLLFILGQRIGRITDFETEFQDGSLVCTSNALSASAMKSPPLIHTEYFKSGTAVAVLLKRHRERVQSHIASYSTHPLRITTVTELRESQNRISALKAAYRGEIGGITLEELEKLAPSKKMAQEVHAEIQEIQQRESA